MTTTSITNLVESFETIKNDTMFDQYIGNILKMLLVYDYLKQDKNFDPTSLLQTIDSYMRELEEIEIECNNNDNDINSDDEPTTINKHTENDINIQLLDNNIELLENQVKEGCVILGAQK